MSAKPSRPGSTGTLVDAKPAPAWADGSLWYKDAVIYEVHVRAFGAVGLITSGAARDLDQVRRLAFSVFSNGAICSHGYSHIVSIQTPVRVGGLAVNPGDLLHGDANGVTATTPAGRG